MSRTVKSWIALLTGPVVWFASMLVNLGLTSQLCARGWKWLMFTIVVIALVVTALAGVLAWRLWRQAGLELPGESGGKVGARRTLGFAGVLLSAGFFVVIIAQLAPTLMLGGCE